MNDTITNTKWYVIRTATGKEKKAKELLEFEIKERGFENYVKQLVIPTEKVFHVRQGKKIATERNHYPGYILIETDPSIIGELSGLHKIVNFVVGFLGEKNPVPLRKEEVERMLGKMDELSNSREEIVDKFSLGESVNIIDGPFSGFIGVVQEVQNDKKRAKIDVKIFGRSTPLELSFVQIQKTY
jgi:transcriptional antiterminator NusG